MNILKNEEPKIDSRRWIPKDANVADDHVEGTILDGALRGDGFGAQYITRDLQNPAPLTFPTHRQKRLFLFLFF